MKRRITHVITGLPVGGTQAMLMKLLAAMDHELWEPQVVSLRDDGALGERIRAMGIGVRTLGMRESIADVAAIPRLIRWVRDRQPKLVQTWLYHADLFGGIAAWRGGVPVVWGIRQSVLRPRDTRRSTLWIARACALLSRRIPTRIICCSESAKTFHADMGYAANKLVVIPNGFDVRAFRPDPDARLAIRAELGVPPATLLVGIVARFDTEKDHSTFVAAAARLHGAMPDVHFLLCGQGVDRRNEGLRVWLTSAGIEANCHLLGPRDDVPRVTAALDVATLSSYGEGFPNVIGEAMACGVPCVATNVGECAAIIADTGRTVPPRDPDGLARGWREILEAGEDHRVRLGAAARRRIETEFDIKAIAKRYAAVYDEVAGRLPI